MRTALQLRPIGPAHLPRCELLYGRALEVVDGQLGPVALFGPGELVAYRLRCRRLVRTFVVRTLDADDPLAALVPGVRPRVRLLLQLRSTGRAKLVARLFAFLARSGVEASDLSDQFFVRVGVALGGRLPAHKIAPALLAHERSSPMLGAAAMAAADPVPVPACSHQALNKLPPERPLSLNARDEFCSI